MAQQQPLVSFVEIDGKLLSGEELDEYCKSHGLCRRCTRVRTHRRILKLFGRGEKWEPLTLHDEETGEYTVYKGYCLRESCYTLGQAKRLLGEIGGGNGRRSSRSNRKRASQRLSANRGIGAGMKRPGRRKNRANPETGSVMSGMVNADDDASVNSSMSGISIGSTMSSSSILSGISNVSGISGFSFGMGRRKSGGRRASRKSSSNLSSASSVCSGVSDISGMEDDDITVDSTMTGTSGALMREKPQDGQVSPIVAHRVEQLITHDYFTVLDLSGVIMRPEDIDAIVEALGKAKTLESVSLDKCKLKDDGVEKIASGLEAGGHINIKKLSLRSNNIGIRGVQALEFLFQTSPTLEELDLSENAINSKGAASILESFRKNRQCALSVLNLSQNEIWDMDDGTFLRTNRTLKELNLDGNFFHDGGVEQIANAISANRNSVLEKLYVGWNGVGDDGATALAKMIERSQTLQVLGLAENDVTNIGARAILSALAVNNSLREISGLYHNQIDRKFIIVAIKRLLHRYGERGNMPTDAAQAEMFSSATLASPVVASTRKVSIDQTPAAKEESKMAEDDEKSRGSEASTNWASTFFRDEDEIQIATAPFLSPTKASVALEAIENWDWGTFGIEEIEKAELENDGLQMAGFDDSDEEGYSDEALPQTLASQRSDRIVIFQSAPLAYFDRATTQHHEVPLLDFEYESSKLKEALANPDEVGANIELVFQNATSDRFQDFFARAVSPIMHMSCYGHPDCIALENGFGYLQALSEEDLKQYVEAGNGKVEVVVIASCHTHEMAKAFLNAGIPHVVCLNRDPTFRDDAIVEFTKGFYQALAKMKTLQDAFKHGLETAKHSPHVNSTKILSKAFKLLPEDGYHDVDIFFKRTLPKAPKSVQPADLSLLPKIPDNFVGREVDMYEILESLRVDDVIRVGGGPGSGKASVLSALSRYVLERPASFQINSVFWLPPRAGVEVDPDSLYGDLVQVLNWILEAEDDIWDEDDYIETRERIMVELEDQRTILIIDGRVFTSEIAGEMLERFLTYLLNEATLKILLITSSDSSRAKTRRSRSEETIVHLGPLDFKSSALLFGNACPSVSIDGNPMVHTAEEFQKYLVPPSVAKQMPEADVKKIKRSRRQQELYDRMGKGNPRDIIEAATSCCEKDLCDLLRLAKKPEVAVTSAAELDAERNKYTAAKEKAIEMKNFLRAKDLAEALEEMEDLRETYPSLEDMQKKEADYKQKFSELLKAKRYDDANLVKRKILAIKRNMMKERYANPVSTQAAAKNSIQQLQERMKGLEALKAANLQNGNSVNLQQGCLRISPTCYLQVESGHVLDFSQGDGLTGLICWANEACDLSSYYLGKELLAKGGQKLEEQVSSVDVFCETEWGNVKCATGEAVTLGPRSFDELDAKFVFLAVPPLSPNNDDTEWDFGSCGLIRNKMAEEDALHYLDTGLRATVRSSFRNIKNTGVEAVAVATITTKPHGSEAYQRSLQVVLETIIEESKRTSVKKVHLVAASGEEANYLIKTALETGLQLEK
ncbi:leucine rich repeat LRR-containing protein [Nitzschia inconspicua]|uniref:Leucine rich repeat LRR-containing protein n=1 Tax=Nitzschia inconspicua TaxID=303405 RepID=A0A9K3PU16_9STRA|nr:leucine rich repeat LRR-containing protein [Nitzschia inconspicua]